MERFKRDILFTYNNGINKEKVSCEIEKYFESNNLGITNEKRELELIVSLTSYPARMYDIYYTIYSLLTQTLKPNKIILWLGEEQFPNKEKDLPSKLLEFIKYGLTVKYTKDLKSYTKLIPTLREYPNSLIVTADDDIFYPKDWLEKLYKEYENNKDCVICHRAHRVGIENEKLIPYNKWEHIIISDIPGFSIFLTGVGGVLYPPNIFYKDILNEELFMELTSTADDIWFWAMVVLNDKKIKIVDEPFRNLIYVNSEREVGLNNDSTLCSSNVRENRNDIQFENVINHYPQIMEKLLNEEYFLNLFKNIDNKKYTYLLSKKGEEILIKLKNEKRRGKQYKKKTQEEIINEALDRLDLIFSKNENVNEDILPKFIDTIPDLCPYKLLEIIAQRIAEYTYPKRDNCIFIDVSNLVINDSGTGVQRVVNSIIKYIPKYSKRKVIFVYSKFNEFEVQGFRYCSKFSDCVEIKNENVIEFIPNDILFFPEISIQQTVGKEKYLKFLQKKGVKIVYFIYDLIPIRYPNDCLDLFKVVFPKYINIVLEVAFGIICDSQAIVDDVKNYSREIGKGNIDNLKIDYVHLGCDFGINSNFLEISKDFNIILEKIKSRVTFIAVSTINPRKMYNQLVEAFEILWRRGKDINLVIVGKELSITKELVKYIENHIELNKRLFKFSGISDEYLNKLYDNSICYIMASKSEGFGLGIIEATYHNKPLILRDLPVFKEIAGENAFYFSGFNGEDLANAIEEWLDLYKENKYPKSDKIKYLTWEESIKMLSDKLELMIK